MDTAEHAQSLHLALAQAVENGVPVLRATAHELARMALEQDRISGNALAGTILRDPLMTLRVLRFLQSHRTRSQTADITTIAHAIMMLGQARFFREFSALPILEDHMQGLPHTLAAVRNVMSRARLASLFARDWAIQRHDMDPEEVMVAALMHDVAELLVLLADPAQLPPLSAPQGTDVRTGLFTRLALPGLFKELTAELQAQHARIANIRLACRLAAHCANGWHHRLIALDLNEIQRLLHISAQEVWERVRRVALQAAREWRYYEARPAASYLCHSSAPAPVHPDEA